MLAGGGRCRVVTGVQLKITKDWWQLFTELEFLVQYLLHGVPRNKVKVRVELKYQEEQRWWE